MALTVHDDTATTGRPLHDVADRGGSGDGAAVGGGRLHDDTATTGGLHDDAATTGRLHDNAATAGGYQR